MVGMATLAKGITDALIADGDLTTLTSTELNETLYFYTQEDYERHAELKFPYCHTFCYRREGNTQNNIYMVSIAVASLRENSISSHNSSYEPTSENIGVVVDKMKELINEELLRMGVGGEKGFTIEAVSEAIVSPKGESDIQYLIDMEIYQKKCFT